MGKITKVMQQKHKESLSPWLKDFVHAVSSAPLPLITQHLEAFPTRWPFPRGDLYHWIPLLNRFDNILERVSTTYHLNDGPQGRDFGCDILLGKGNGYIDYRDDSLWDMAKLAQHGYPEDGDRQLLVAILKFSTILLHHCGNRSIYASSAQLNDLLNSTSLPVLQGALNVGHQLALRYQASVKRMGGVHSRQLSTALLANHYNIDLERVHQLAQPFAKTPIVNFSADPFSATTPNASSSKGKEKAHTSPAKNGASMFANNLVSIATPDQPDEGCWNGWGDVKITYYPTATSGQESAQQGIKPDQTHSSTPATPTPLRRSTTGPQYRSPRADRSGGRSSDDGSPVNARSGALGSEDGTGMSQRHFEIPQAVILSSSIYELLSRCPPEMPKSSQYELLNRLRVSKALLGSPESRQLALAVRLMAITNLSYIQPENVFIEKALKQDNDEPRRYQLVYQLVELIHPSTVGATPMPLWLQSIALQLLEGISTYPSKYSDVLSALNANVNHGVLLYVIRKTVDEIKEDKHEATEFATGEDSWRTYLFSLALHMTTGHRIGPEMISAGLMDILVEILNIRSKLAERNASMVLAFLDGVIYNIQGAFQAFVNAKGLDSIAQLIVDTTDAAIALTASGLGTKPELRSAVVDYEIPFYQQQTLKWLLKFIHHIMTNSYSYGGNTDRLLRNLVDKSQLLHSLRHIIEHMKRFGSVVWTHAVTILGDFINNDPTSFTAILESGMIETFLESITGHPVPVQMPKHQDEQKSVDSPSNVEAEEYPSSPDSDASDVIFDTDDREHPPTEEDLEAPRVHPLAQGILPSQDAIAVIPNILNSISLNNTGMRMVVSSRAFDSYLEIFQSAAHIHCMEASPEVVRTVGSSFDELARHHPSLRPAIANAVLDMVARVAHLGKKKATTAGWGSKLVVTTRAAGSRKGKEKATSGEDIDMVDATDVQETISSVPGLGEQPSTATSYNEITPYLNAVATFLHSYLQNSSLKPLFVHRGGTELVLDLSELPSLPYDFGESAAARTLQHVVSQLVEQSPILGLPSLLKRTQAAVDALGPLLSRGESSSERFFAPFLQTSESGDIPIGNPLPGTQVVKALLNSQSLLKTLSNCFPFSSSSRNNLLMLHPVNVFDYYTRLIQSLGPLLRVVLAEEMGIAAVVPKHWNRKAPVSVDRPSEAAVQTGAASVAPAADGEVGPLQDVLSDSLARPGEEIFAGGRLRKPSQQEQTSAAYLNFLTLRGLLHSFMPTTFPFFQQIGKALLPRRQRSAYQRFHHIRIAEALAKTILGQLHIGDDPTNTDYHCWIVMLHTLHEMVIDHSRAGERSLVHVIIPVLLAFREHGGLDRLNKMLEVFIGEVKRDEQGSSDTKPKLAALGIKKILELYALIVSEKNIIESVGQVELSSREDRHFNQMGSQLLVELRMGILPVTRQLWESDVIEKVTTPVFSKIVSILKTIALAHNEDRAHRRSSKTPPPSLFNQETVKFDWQVARPLLVALSEHFDGPDGELLIQEAIYRAHNAGVVAEDYCKAHTAGLAGSRHPIPLEDAYQPPNPTLEQDTSKDATPAVSGSGLLPPELMLLDQFDQEAADMHDQDDDDHSSEGSSDEERDEPDQGEETNDANGASSTETANNQDGPTATSRESASDRKGVVSKDDLDDERKLLNKDLIDRCLDVIRAHPNSVHEVSDLIAATSLSSDSEEGRQEVGETVVNALMSFAIDEETKKENARSIAAYAHLLSMLLQESEDFFRGSVKTLRDGIDEYLGFLKVSPGNTPEDLPPWIPYILLIFELMLKDDEQVVEAKWKPPATENDAVESPVLQVKEPIVSEDHRRALLDAILDILPRTGKDELLAIAVLRILVILTRNRSVAKSMGDRKNLQRLFLMTKQLSGIGSTRFRDTRIGANILTILRHVVEDEEVIREIMRSEIRNYIEFPVQRTTPRANEISTFLGQLSHVALRAPETFIEVTNEMVKLSTGWSTPASDGSYRPAPTLALKDNARSSQPPAPPKDDSVEPTVQATEDLNINDIRPSTETGDKVMTDAPKTPAHEHKRRILGNPDGVIHFLLEQLLSYREVDDAEPIPAPRLAGDTMSSAPTDSPPARAETIDSPAGESKDRKPKLVFKADDHPIFMYRCFLLHCLTELLQSYNRTKMEFINFKRGAALQSNTPLKPRSSVLNYLLNDLLCMSSLTVPMDTITLKKKMSASDQVRLLLVALVSKTSETTIDRSRDGMDYDEEPDLLFVRKFVLDTVLRAYKDASTGSEPFDVRYAKMLSLAELMNHMTGDKESKDSLGRRMTDARLARSQNQLKRLMFEKGYLTTMTASIADIDLTFPGVKRTIKYILRVLRVLTTTGIVMSRSNMIPSPSVDNVDDDIASASSLSSLGDDREETPDLYRNSALGMMEAVDHSSEESDDGDEEMYDDEFDEEIEYEEEMSEDGENNISDVEEELDEMGDIEGLPGTGGVVQVLVGEDEDDDESMDEDEESSEHEESDEDGEGDHSIEEMEEIIDDEGNPINDDGGSGWENESSEDDEEADDVDYEGQGQDLAEVHIHGMNDNELNRFETIIRSTIDADVFDGNGMRNFDEHYIDEGGEEDDDEEDEEEMDEDEYLYDDYPNDEPPPNMPAGLGWDALDVEPGHGGHRHRHGGMRSPFPPFMFGSPRDPLGGMSEFRNYFRPRPHPSANVPDERDGVNPLLRRAESHRRDASPRPGHHSSVRLEALLGPGIVDHPISFLNDFLQHFPELTRHHGSAFFQITEGGPRGEIREINLPFSSHRGMGRDSRTDTRRENYHEPSLAVSYATQSTMEHWQEESRMLFGMNPSDKIQKHFFNRILAKLTPAAIQQAKEEKAQKEERERKVAEEKKRREEVERKEREAKEAEEKAAREKKEAEEKERADAEAAEAEEAAALAAAETAEAVPEVDVAEPEGMEGVESTGGAPENAQTEEPAAEASRIMTTIRGEQIDVTELGIDPEYLGALPEEFREEVIAQALTARRSEARQQGANAGEGGGQSDNFNEFLEALPEDLRQEIMQQERQEQRRRAREEERRQAAVNGQEAPPQDMDAASILLTFSPALREQILLEQGDELMDQLTPELVAQARSLADRHRPPPAGGSRTAREAVRHHAIAQTAAEPKPEAGRVVQMLDKAGIATLLRLMFITQQGTIRSCLFNVFVDVCENRQNRLEVVSNLLQILQDGSTDMQAVERSFGQLSLKAKQPKDKEPRDKEPRDKEPRDKEAKTNNSLKRTSTGMSNASSRVQPNSEISPLLIVQQCLDLLVDLSGRSSHIPSLFLTEHEAVGTSLKRSFSRRGKNKDVKANKYAINSLLALLDRDLVMESSSVMQHLADLLNRVTLPLQALERRRKEILDEAKKAAEKKEGSSEATPATAEAAGVDAAATDTAATATATAVATETEPSVALAGDGAQPEMPAAAEAESSKAPMAKPKESEARKARHIQPPVIPVHNLTLVINIFVARECSSKTFQNTISTIKNLSNIPGAKLVFGQELVRQAKKLSENIVSDLGDLLPHILKAETGTEIQGIALAKFSPGASEQNKLLRVLTALDHLFDNKTKKAGDGEATPSDDEKQEFLSSLYHNATFGVMWEKLSLCLGAIRKRENMLSVATILLPLIESLMVVCKNTTLTDAPASLSQSQSQMTKDMLLSSPPPENRIAGLFFTFTEEHRRILNELVRHSPKLMSGTFSLLVKNPKVLEFDNKRNYFNRSVHAKSNGARPNMAPLQLSVRREQVFHDSFKSLYFKSGDEMKYGKLSIRFHGEEGVDAGGVTREWFQVLSRQMFDPNYGLFIPVSSDRTTFHPNKLSGINEEHLMFFKFIGRIIGKALYEGRLLDCYFSRAVYKRLLGKPVSVKDIESMQPDYYKSLVWMLENDITDIITETFSIDENQFGLVKTVDLMENGHNIAVTESNKHEYVRLMVEHKLLGSVTEQMENFLKGFHDIIPADLIAIFNEQELELLISGMPDIDVDDWKSNSEYHNYTAASSQIQWFWRAVRSFDKEERAKLLQFVTGTSKVPLNGFKELEGMNGINRFNVHRDYGNKERLPSSHTCFNQLDLPEYESYEMLRAQLMKAITAGNEYFGFA